VKILHPGNPPHLGNMGLDSKSLSADGSNKLRWETGQNLDMDRIWMVLFHLYLTYSKYIYICIYIYVYVYQFYPVKLDNIYIYNIELYVLYWIFQCMLGWDFSIRIMAIPWDLIKHLGTLQ
jgi:hypothetical protein